MSRWRLGPRVLQREELKWGSLEPNAAIIFLQDISPWSVTTQTYERSNFKSLTPLMKALRQPWPVPCLQILKYTLLEIQTQTHHLNEICQRKFELDDILSYINLPRLPLHLSTIIIYATPFFFKKKLITFVTRNLRRHPNIVKKIQTKQQPGMMQQGYARLHLQSINQKKNKSGYQNINLGID